MIGSLKNFLLVSPFLFFIAAILALFKGEWGPAGIGFIISLFLFWLIFLRKRRNQIKKK